MFLWKKNLKTPNTKKIKKITNHLRIKTVDETYIYSVTVKSMKSKITPWIDFYRWFFFRTSDRYMFHYSNGCQLINRVDIKHFRIDFETEYCCKKEE